MKRIFHIALSVWLSLLLLFGSTAKEFIHLFAGHQDTVHEPMNGDGLVMDSQHHHCTFLSFSLPAFLSDPQDAPVFFPVLVHTIKHYPFYQPVFREQPVIPLFRGPPAV